MYTYELYVLDDGIHYGYRILYNGAMIIDQPFAPGESGFVLMSEGQARAYAEADCALYNTPPEDPSADPEPTPEPEPAQV